MQREDKSIVVIGGAGLISSHVVEEPLLEPVKEVLIYDNFTRGREDNIRQALRDPRCKVFEIGGDITQPDILNKAMEGIDGVVHLTAFWLLHCHEFPESAFDVNIKGTFNVIMAAIRNKGQRVVYSSFASVYGNALELPMTKEHPCNNDTFYGATKIAGEHLKKPASKTATTPPPLLHGAHRIRGQRRERHRLQSNTEASKETWALIAKERKGRCRYIPSRGPDHCSSFPSTLRVNKRIHVPATLGAGMYSFSPSSLGGESSKVY